MVSIKTIALVAGLAIASSNVVCKIRSDDAPANTNAPINPALIDANQAKHWEWCSGTCRENAKIHAERIINELDLVTQKPEIQPKFYASTGDTFKKNVSYIKWQERFKKRKRLGAPVQRVHESTQGTFKNLPNIEKNQRYMIVTFDCMFEKQKGFFTEQITLQLTDKQEYKFVGYYVALKKTYDY